MEAQGEGRVDSAFRINRLGIIMRPDQAREEECEGVLNPGAARAPDGNLYLFPRLVGKNNYSRVGIARVIFNDDGIPVGVERLGIALEPEQPYELRPGDGTGGCEDPRVTFVEPLGIYVMSYVAWGTTGPRIALAISEDCLDWERLGLVDFQPDIEAHYGVLFNHYDNKDAAFMPVAAHMKSRGAFLGMLHRPLFTNRSLPHGVAETAPGIWISGCNLDSVKRDIRALCVMNRHIPLVEPVQQWESQRIGLGTPPVQTRLGFMSVYHGVSGKIGAGPGENHVNYEAGVLICRREKDELLHYRSTTPILIPESEEETHGTVDNVVFPTGIDQRTENVYDVYYGMADKYIGAARMSLPNTLHYEEAHLQDANQQRLLKLT